MKNLFYLSILILSLACTSSCEKEENIITTTTTIEEPQEGDLEVLNGIVRDTSGNFIAQAAVKVILDGLELETETDENGAWSIEIPDSFTEGFVVAHKINYTKGIQLFNGNEGNDINDIFLGEDPANQELLLNLAPQNLFSVRGTLVDQFGNPVPDVDIVIKSILNVPSIAPYLNGFTKTNDNGQFHILYEDIFVLWPTVFITHSSLSTSSIPTCVDDFIIGLDVEDMDIDLGTLEYGVFEPSFFNTSILSDGSSCFDGVTLNAKKFNITSNLEVMPNVENLPLGELSLEHCNNETGVFFIGTESIDRTRFDGVFVTQAEVEDSYVFDMCPIADRETYIEVKIGDNTTLIVNGLSSSISGITGFDLVYRTSFKRNARGGVESFSFYENNVEIYSLDPNGNNYSQLVQVDSDFISGVIQGFVVDVDGNSTDLKIRFRVRN